MRLPRDEVDFPELVERQPAVILNIATLRDTHRPVAPPKPRSSSCEGKSLKSAGDIS